MARLPRNHPWTRRGNKVTFDPFQPGAGQAVPPGLYDPVLDATLGQAKRGFNDLVQSTATQAQRLQTDYGLQGDSIDRSQTRGMEDLATEEAGIGRSFDRGQQDLATARTREGENYGLATQGLERGYSRLANQQRQQQSAFGVLRGGAALQAARKRTANMALDRQPMDLEHARAGEDFAQTDSRLGQDRAAAMAGVGTARTRLGEDSDLARGNLALQYAPPDAANPLGGRAFQDLGSQLGIAGRELGATGIDTERAKAFSAAQMGYVPPKPQYNEQVNPLTGGATREYKINGFVYTVGKGGKIIRKRRA